MGLDTDALPQTRTSSLGASRPLPPSADIGPGGQSGGQAAQFCLAPFLFAFPPHRLAIRIFRLEPCLGWAASIRCVQPLRYDALKAHSARMIEHGRPVARQMLNELDGLPLGPADKSGEPLL